jgi:hypothetical protein
VTPENEIQIIGRTASQDKTIFMNCDRVMVQDNIYMEDDRHFIPVIRVKYGESLKFCIIFYNDKDESNHGIWSGIANRVRNT